MIIAKDDNRCICLKNRKKNCSIQCNYKKYNNSDYCKRHSKGTYKTIHDYNLCIIQSYIRKYLTMKLIKRIYGPAYLNPCLSHDNIDPVSLEKIWEYKNNTKINICEIPRYLIFSYEDNNKIRLYNVISLLKIKSFDNKNPITRENIDININQNINDRISFMKNNNLWNEDLMRLDNLCESSKIKQIVTEITHIFCNNNIYINNDDILDIKVPKLQQLYNECNSILRHPDNTSFYSKFKDHTNFFQIPMIDIRNVRDRNKLQKIVFTEILNLLKLDCIQDNIKYLTYIILGAFMYVSPKIYSLYSTNLEFST